MSEALRVRYEDPEQMEDQEDQEVELGFVVDDDQKAELCLTKIREKTAELEKWKDHFKRQQESIEKKLSAEISYFEGLLNAFFARMQEDGLTKSTKTQASYTLPTGKLVLKHREPEYERDDSLLIPWLESTMPEFVKVKKELDWRGLKNQIFDDGEMTITQDGDPVPGIKVIPRDDIFKVEVK